MVNRHTHLSSLTPSEVSHLANLLNLPPRLLLTTTTTATGSSSRPSTLWLATQSRLLTTTSPSSDIPKPLLASHSLLARLTAATHRAVHPDLLAVLCPSHSGLNAALVRRVFLLVDAEVTSKMGALRRYLRCPERYACLDRKLSGVDRGDAVVRELVERLAEIAGLWLTPEAWKRCYYRVVEGRCEERRRPRVEGGCEACILAAVGGDEQAVGDLWAVLLGRTHRRKGKKKPVLSGLVEAWMKGLGQGERGREVREESEALGRVVKRVRRAVWRWKHGREGDGSKETGTSKSGNASVSASATDSGYVSSTTSGGELSTSSKRLAVSHGAGIGKHASSSSSSCGQQPPRHGDVCDGNLLHNGTAVEYDIFLRRRPLPPHQFDTSNASALTPSAVACEEEDHENDESDSSDDLDDAHPDAARQLHARASGWYSTHTDIVDSEQQHPAFRASVLEGGIMLPSVDSLHLSRIERESLGDVHDPAHWTDVSVVTSGSTRSMEWGRHVNSRVVENGDAPNYWARVPSTLHSVLGSSSSIYSNDGTAVPHPAPSAASSLSLITPAFGTADRSLLRNYAPSSLVTEWPNPFAAVEGDLGATPTTSIASSSRSTHMPSRSSQHKNGADPAPPISPIEFQSALHRLSLGPTARGDSTVLPVGMVLPEQSVSIVGGDLVYAIGPGVEAVLARESIGGKVAEKEKEKEEDGALKLQRALVRNRVTAIEEAERRGKGWSVLI